MKEIKLARGMVSIVDDEDFEELSKHKWFYSNGYAIRSITLKNKKQSKAGMHIAIMGKKEGFEIDHINGDRLDNRRENLRHVTHQQNIQNQKPSREGNSSRYKGVFWNKRDEKWRSLIKLDGKTYHLGCYKGERDAAIAYNEAAIRFFGEYARLNALA